MVVTRSMAVDVDSSSARGSGVTGMAKGTRGATAEDGAIISVAIGAARSGVAVGVGVTAAEARVDVGMGLVGVATGTSGVGLGARLPGVWASGSATAEVT